MNEEDEVLDVAGACALLKIKERTLRNWIGDPEKNLPFARMGKGTKGILRFRRSALLGWLAEQEKATAERRREG